MLLCLRSLDALAAQYAKAGELLLPASKPVKHNAVFKIVEKRPPHEPSEAPGDGLRQDSPAALRQYNIPQCIDNLSEFCMSWPALCCIFRQKRPKHLPFFVGQSVHQLVAGLTLPSGMKVEVRFCGGNHEDHDTLAKLVEGSKHAPCEIAKNLFYQPRGSRYILNHGRTFFFAGGAKSVDFKARIEDITWFDKEVLQLSDLPDELPKADIAISHTIPRIFSLQQKLGLSYPPDWWDTSPDPSEVVLDEVLHVVMPPVLGMLALASALLYRLRRCEPACFGQYPHGHGKLRVLPVILRENRVIPFNYQCLGYYEKFLTSLT